MIKYYLKHGDQIICTLAKLVYDENENVFKLVSLEDDSYYDGEIVEFDNGKPYIERNAE